MQWLNEPRKWTALDRGLSARSEANTDFWRKPDDGEIRHSGHFYYDVVAGDFTATVKIRGEYGAQYDQAGLMVRIDDETWLKCGIEFLDGNQFASAVVTRDCSDWSITSVRNPREVWFQCVRNGTTLTVRYSLDGVEYAMIRESYLPSSPIQQVGMMLAAPQGDGFDVLFEDFLLDDSPLS